MIQAFYTGVSGIKTHQYGIDVISDNLSNLSTNGFRSSNAEFSSLFQENISTDAQLSSVDSNIGLGSKLNAVTMNQNIGVYQLTDRSTDLAIMGDGWFAIQGQGKPLYTRDGAFTFDANRDLVTDDGYYVLGTIGNNIEDGVLVETLAEVPLGDAKSQQKLSLPQELQVAVQPTTEVKFYANIGLEDTVRVMSGKAIDPQNNNNAIRLEFSKADPQVSPGTQWNVVATAQSNNLVTVVNSETQAITYEPETIYDTQTGVVAFDEAGQLISNSLPAIDNNGASVVVNLGTGYDGLISINDTIRASSESNGKESGELVGYDINRNGEVVAAFTNGVQSSVATLAIYHFINDGGLERVSGTRFAESSNSGEAIFFQDSDGNNIKGVAITNYKLEGSNVEIETALTELIVMQRSYDANSKSITTAHEMLQKALDMDAK